MSVNSLLPKTKSILYKPLPGLPSFQKYKTLFLKNKHRDQLSTKLNSFAMDGFFLDSIVPMKKELLIIVKLK